MPGVQKPEEACLLRFLGGNGTGTYVSFLLPRQENSNHCPYKENRCQSDKQIFKHVKGCPEDGSFRVMIIPA